MSIPTAGCTLTDPIAYLWSSAHLDFVDASIRDFYLITNRCGLSSRLLPQWWPQFLIRIDELSVILLLLFQICRSLHGIDSSMSLKGLLIFDMFLWNCASRSCEGYLEFIIISMIGAICLRYLLTWLIRNLSGLLYRHFFLFQIFFSLD